MILWMIKVIVLKLKSVLTDIFLPPIVHIKKRLLKPNPSKRRINIGGGKWYQPRWENVDFMDNDTFVDYQIDLRANVELPFQNDSVEIVFSSHCFEHISDENSLFTLCECYRVLAPGGTIRISVPDMDKAIEAFRRGDESFFDIGGVSCTGSSIEDKLLNFFASYEMDGYKGGPRIPVQTVRTKLSTLNKYEFCDWCV